MMMVLRMICFPCARKFAPATEEREAHKYPVGDLAIATDNFSSERIIGKGGFGEVFRGVLESGLPVAVKRIKPAREEDGEESQLDDHNREEQKKMFTLECNMLTRLHHQNLVKFYGYALHMEDSFLVCEYVPGGSLSHHLFHHPVPLSWETRVNVALGVAKGINYLHRTARPPVIHRDLKPDNVLLDTSLNPKLCDFGLARFGPRRNKTHVTTQAAGTFGYIEPKHMMTNHVTLESDIYGFGVILFELVTGRKVIDISRPAPEINLVTWVRPYLRDSTRFKEIVDPKLGNRYPEQGLQKMVGIAASCVQDIPKRRPSSQQLVFGLSKVANTC